MRGLGLLVAGVAGGLAADALGVPAGAVVGSLVGGGAYRLAVGDAGPWRERYGHAGRSLLGAVIGAAFGPDVLMPLKTALLPMLGVIACLVGAGMALGWVLRRRTPLDAPTALISSMPGGLPAMAAMSEALGADATVVAAIHFARLTTILMVMPVLIPLLAGGSATTAAVLPRVETAGVTRTALTLLGGLVSGELALRLRVPTGDLVGPILAVGAVNLLWAGQGPLDGRFRTAAVLFIGVGVGAGVTRESLRRLRQSVLPATAVIGVLIGAGLALGWGLAQVTSLDLTTALLSSVPGGASTMPAVAHDLGGDMRLVAALHLMRQLVVLAALPAALSYVFRRRARGPTPTERPSL